MSETPAQEPARSPFAGCLILIVMAIVALVLVASASWALKKQANALASFTEEKPRPAPLTSVVDHQATFNSLVSRLNHLNHEIDHKRPAELSLSPTDLNLAVAHYDALKSFRGQLSIDQISGKEVSGTIHLPLNSTEKIPSAICDLLGIDQRPNNLNGSFTAKPVLTDGKFILNLTSVIPTRGEIPEEFLVGISRLMVSGEVPEESALQEKLSALTEIRLQSDALILAYRPDAPPPSVQEASDEMAAKAKQLVALGAIIFLLTMILAFILISRWRKSKRAV